MEGSAILRGVRRLTVLLLLAVALAGCSSDDTTPVRQLLAAADVDAFQKKIDSERGKPVVVNKWA